VDLKRIVIGHTRSGMPIYLIAGGASKKEKEPTLEERWDSRENLDDEGRQELHNALVERFDELRSRATELSDD